VACHYTSTQPLLTLSCSSDLPASLSHPCPSPGLLQWLFRFVKDKVLALHLLYITGAAGPSTLESNDGLAPAAAAWGSPQYLARPLEQLTELHVCVRGCRACVVGIASVVSLLLI